MCIGISNKKSLLILNTTLFLLGCGILSVGFWSQYDKNFSSLWNSLEVSRIIDANALNGASLLLIISGLSSVVISFAGLYGILKKDRCFLTTYCLIMCIILFLEIAAAAVFLSYQTQPYEKLRVGLNKTVEKINKDNDTVAFKVMESIQTFFKCCGCNGPMDYTHLESQTSCLKNSSSTETPVYYTNGCYDTITAFISSNLPAIIGLSVSIIFLEIFCLINSIRICSSIKYQGYEDI